MGEDTAKVDVSTRTSRVEQLLRREVAALLLRGDFRDPALQETAAISVTGASVSSDLSSARVFVDVLGDRRPIADVLRALNAAAGLFRSHIGKVARLRRVPTLRFESDVSIARGVAIERVLHELAQERAQPGPLGDDSPVASEETPGSTEDTPGPSEDTP